MPKREYVKIVEKTLNHIEKLPLKEMPSQYNLALRYKNGNGIEQDNQKIVELYEKAAKQGHASAQFNLALCYENGDVHRKTSGSI